MYDHVNPSFYPWFAPLPGPMIAHLRLRLERTKRATPSTSLQVLFELLREKRRVTYFYMDPFVQARLEGGTAAESFSTGWLLSTLGAQAPDKKEPVPQQTLSYWRSKGLIRFQEHGLPEYASAAALYLARILDNEAERNFLPRSMTEEEQDWWCFTQAGPDAPVRPWRASQLDALPASTFCWTPWLGAVWEAGWVKRRDQTLAMRWARLAPGSPLSYRLEPADMLLWMNQACPVSHTAAEPPATSHWNLPFALHDLKDHDLLQAIASLVLHRLAWRHAAHLDNRAFAAYAHQDETRE